MFEPTDSKQSKVRSVCSLHEPYNAVKKERKRGGEGGREREARRDEILSNVSDHDSRHTHVSLVAF